MFTGIVRGICPIVELIHNHGIMRYAIELGPLLINDLQKGASIAIDGVCQTVVSLDKNKVWFDAIAETLQRTTLNNFKLDQLVNVERAARFGDDIGGHILSGHVFGTVKVVKIKRDENNCAFTFQCQPDWIKYLFSKGYIALNGVSLTLVDVQPEGFFTVHFIPETLQQTTFGQKKEEDLINLEFDSQTQTIVDTLERLYQRYVPQTIN